MPVGCQTVLSSTSSARSSKDWASGESQSVPAAPRAADTRDAGGGLAEHVGGEALDAGEVDRVDDALRQAAANRARTAASSAARRAAVSAAASPGPPTTSR